jgi:ABC-type transport system involved in cytochrome bd biosynthesis fused ATPase/permease subunit
MENFIVIAIALVIVLLILRFVFKAAKGIITIALAIVLLAVGLHYFSPKTLDDLIGAERHDRWTEQVTSKIDTLKTKAGEEIQKNLDKVEKTK